MVDEEDAYADVLELIQDLQSRAADNEKEAGEIALLLASYSANLEDANGKLKAANDSVEADNRTSTEAIERLQGDEDILGSISQIEKMSDMQQAEYRRNVTIASTTLTYAWVPVIGTIAAAVVAGVYGRRAVESLEAYNKSMAKIEKENKALTTAIKAHEVQRIAGTGLTHAKEHTEAAIQEITVVKNAWAALAGNLSVVATKVERMTKSSDDEVRLKGKRVVKLYAKQAEEAWDELYPAVLELTNKPYIVVEDNDKSITEVVEEIKKIAA